MLMKAQDAMKTSTTSTALDEGVPVSVKIRERVMAARKRFHANDNIAEFIQPGEMDELLDEALDESFPASDPPSITQPRDPDGED